MNKLTILGVFTEEELENEFVKRKNELWKDWKFFGLRNVLFLVLCYWIGYFCYWFCQDSFKYYIKHFKAEVQVPIILMMLISAIIWFVVARYWYLELARRESLVNWYNDELNKIDLKGRLNSYNIQNFVGLKVKNKKIFLNYLTNKVFSSIIINEEICKSGILDEKHDELVIDFGKHIIYSTKM